MHVAQQLIQEIEDFAARNPNHKEASRSLIDAVRRIDRQFGGDTRETLLEQARDTFRKQIHALENAERTVATLERLRDNQRELVKALKRMSQQQRPQGATLH